MRVRKKCLKVLTVKIMLIISLLPEDKNKCVHHLIKRFEPVSQCISYFVLSYIGLKETPSQEDWLISILPENSKVGVDPWIIAAGKLLFVFRFLLKHSGKLSHRTTLP